MPTPEAPITDQDEIPIRGHIVGSIAHKELQPKIFCKDCMLVLGDLYIEVVVHRSNAGFPYGIENVTYHLCWDHGVPLLLESVFPAAA